MNSTGIFLSFTIILLICQVLLGYGSSEEYQMEFPAPQNQFIQIDFTFWQNPCQSVADAFRELLGRPPNQRMYYSIYKFPGAPSKNLIILLPGYSQHKDSDEYKQFARQLQQAFIDSKQQISEKHGTPAQQLFLDSDLIIVNPRYHGEDNQISGGSYSYGDHEVDDLEALIQALPQHYENIGLIGFSVGGKIILRYTARASASEKLRALIAVATPADLHEVNLRLFEAESAFHSINKSIQRNGGVTWWQVLPWRWINLTFLKFVGAIWRNPALNDVNKINNRIAILFVHGRDDWFIKPYHSQVLYEKSLVHTKKLALLDTNQHAENMIPSFGRLLAENFVAWFQQRYRDSFKSQENKSNYFVYPFLRQHRDVFAGQWLERQWLGSPKKWTAGISYHWGQKSQRESVLISFASKRLVKDYISFGLAAKPQKELEGYLRFYLDTFHTDRLGRWGLNQFFITPRTIGIMGRWGNFDNLSPEEYFACVNFKLWSISSFIGWGRTRPGNIQQSVSTWESGWLIHLTDSLLFQYKIGHFGRFELHRPSRYLQSFTLDAELPLSIVSQDKLTFALSIGIEKAEGIRNEYLSKYIESRKAFKREGAQIVPMLNLSINYYR